MANPTAPHDNTPHDVDELSGIKTTGHEWDGIKELNNPLPRWWLIVFYASVAASVVYWVLMPAWPGLTDFTPGVRGHLQRSIVSEQIDQMHADRSAFSVRLTQAESLQAIESDPDLLQYAMAAGASAFGDNCATCHGAGGQGFPGYPNLNDDAWLWGGTLGDIRQTLRYGIRADHPETHLGLMQAYGRDGLLSRDEIFDVVEHVVALSGREADASAAARGAQTYAEICSTCHGAAGTGDMTQGAPNLTDAIWLYGGDRDTLRETLWNGRAGVMPAWSERLDAATIDALAVYVHTLGGGQ